MPIDTVNDKLEQATTIKEQIRQAVLSKGITFPDTVPFSGYPAKVLEIYVSTMQGNKDVTPDAAGQVVTPDEGYDGLTSVTLPAEPNLIPANISVGVSIFGVVGTNEVPVFDVNALLAGTLTEITSGTPAIRAYMFYNDTPLQIATLNNVTSMGNYAFYGCSGLTTVQMAALTEVASYVFQNCGALTSFTANALTSIGTYGFYGCQNLVTLDLSHITELGTYALYNCKKIANIGTLTLTDIPSYACYYLASSASTGFVYAPATAATLGTYAFQYAKMTRLSGVLGNISDYGIANCTALTQIDAKFTGSLGQYALANDTAVSSLDIDTDSNITSLGNYAFYYLGWSRSSPSTNIFEMDLRNSTFGAINQYSFGYIQYANIYLPTSVGTINSYAFSYSKYINIYFASAVPPTISNTNWLSNATYYKLLVPYNYTNAYKTKTNWTAQVANIVGYAPTGSFVAGATLPVINGEGMALTWYSDVAKTTVIATVPDGSPELYCDSSDRSAWVVTVNEDVNTTVTLVDSEGVTYTTFPAYVPIGRGITLDVAEHEGWNNNTTVDGTVVTLPYTIALLSTDITVKSSSWQGEIDPDFATCTWANLKKAVDAGVASSMFTVGSTRTITTKDGQTFTIRLANNTDNMYAYANGSGTTGFVLEFVELWKDYKYMNPTSTNTGGWNASYMRQTVMPLIMEQLPDDMVAVIASIKTKSCYSGTDATLVESTDNLFLPAEREIFASRSYSRTEEWNALTEWQYYAANSSASIRIKKRSGSACNWWERSPYTGNTNTFCIVYSNGSATINGANNTSGVAPGFCI